VAGVVEIPEPLAHQLDFYLGESPNKALCCGRRWGKSKSLVGCATVGHGPLDYDAQGVLAPRFKGISHGQSYDVGWLSPNNNQAEKIWQEEIEPRFNGVPGVTVVRSHPRHVRVQGGGTLWMYSMEAPNNIRGARLAGMIVDEAKDHKDLREVLRRVVVPTIVDLDGWIVVAGTPELGSDYNELLDEILDGKRPEWALHQGRTADNLLLPPAAIQRLRGEYVGDPDGEAEELEAAILRERGALFDRAMFQAHTYDAASHLGVRCGELDPSLALVPFTEVAIFADLAASVKQTADYTVVKVVGITDVVRGARRAVVLDVIRKRIEGPEQLTLLREQIQKWRPRKCYIESVGYQMTAVQHMRRTVVGVEFVEVRPDKDKRSRAVPWAGMLARGEVFYPRGAAWMSDYAQEHVRFKGDGKGHDDQVDTGSMLAAVMVAPAISGRARRTGAF
jgi:predicted phage terminase large subunit-like protein